MKVRPQFSMKEQGSLDQGAYGAAGGLSAPPPAQQISIAA
jgi:hypothetical protein